MKRTERIKNHQKCVTAAKYLASCVADAAISDASHDVACSCEEANLEAPCGIDVLAKLKNNSITLQESGCCKNQRL